MMTETFLRERAGAGSLMVALELGRPVTSFEPAARSWLPRDSCAHDAGRPVLREASTSTVVRQLWREVRRLPLEDLLARVVIAERALLSERGVHRPFGDIFAVRAYCLALDDDTLSAGATAEQALRCGASTDFAKLAALVLRFCCWKAGASAAPPVLRAPAAPHSLGGCGRTESREGISDILDRTLSAAIAFSTLEVGTAERLARVALQHAHRVGSTIPSPVSCLARILYERGQLDAAEVLLRRHLPIIRSAGGPDCLGQTYSILARTAAHRGDNAGALQVLDEGRTLAESRNWPRLLAELLYEQIRLCQAGDAGRIETWLGQLANLAERHRPAAQCARSEIACHAWKAELHRYLSLGGVAAPHAALRGLRQWASLSQDLRATAWVDLAEAQVLWLEGDEATSLEHLLDALHLAQTSGLRQVLIDAGPPMAAMIDRLVARGGLSPETLSLAIYISGALSSSRRARADTSARTIRRGGDSLTPREREVLKLIGQGRTNRLIARSHGVTQETVKTHVRNIFQKLGVAGRAQAVSKAEEIGLLSGG